MPRNSGLFDGAAVNPMIVKQPAAAPAAPMPAMARPTMKVDEFGAAPQMRLPSSKIKIEKRKAVLSGKYL